jgi:hypothetical protein
MREWLGRRREWGCAGSESGTTGARLGAESSARERGEVLGEAQGETGFGEAGEVVCVGEAVGVGEGRVAGLGSGLAARAVASGAGDRHLRPRLRFVEGLQGEWGGTEVSVPGQGAQGEIGSSGGVAEAVCVGEAVGVGEGRVAGLGSGPAARAVASGAGDRHLRPPLRFVEGLDGEWGGTEVSVPGQGAQGETGFGEAGEVVCVGEAVGVGEVRVAGLGSGLAARAVASGAGDRHLRPPLRSVEGLQGEWSGTEVSVPGRGAQAQGERVQESPAEGAVPWLVSADCGGSVRGSE